jgi:pimeloyl-ACP methyl ester carboxylesterase
MERLSHTVATLRRLIGMPNMGATTRDGRDLHLERHGQGTPMVVFEAGMGFSRNSWGAVLPAVAERTEAVAYDRSGLGRSEPDAARRDLARVTDDLVDLLDHLGAGPFVLVGHSWGGPIVRSAAARTPERIAGLVLVDQTDEGCELFLSAGNARQAKLAAKVMPALVRTGLLRRMVSKQAAHLPEPWATGLRTEDGTLAAVHEQLAELRWSTDDLRRLHDEPLLVPDVPVSVISGARAGRLERGRRGDLVAAHRARADALPQGRHVTAERSGHYVPFTEPDLVAAEILRIVDAVRA